jgi:hypothetical protein
MLKLVNILTVAALAGVAHGGTLSCPTDVSSNLHVEGRISKTTMDAKVVGIPWDVNWEQECDKCGQYLEKKKDILPGWGCQKDSAPSFGIWLKGCDTDGKRADCPKPTQSPTASPIKGKTCQDVWFIHVADKSGDYTCGERIDFLKTSEGLSDTDAKNKVANEFEECWPCHVKGSKETVGTGETNKGTVRPNLRRV